jgi:putative transposase
MIVEARDRQALSRGMKGLGVRIAKAVNRVMGRKGNVVPDRYHARILRTPTEVRRARSYVLTNGQRHYGVVGRDRFTSHRPLVTPRTWMLRRLE